MRMKQREGKRLMMQAQDKKQRNWLWTLLVVENSVILLALVIFGVRACLRSVSCYPVRDINSIYAGNYPDYSYMYVHTPPNKLVYIAGKDNSLDLVGGKVCYSVYPEHENGLHCAQGGDADCENIQSMDTLQVSTEADFSKPGVYSVTIRDDSFMQEDNHWTHPTRCHFYIQVISPDYVE